MPTPNGVSDLRIRWDLLLSGLTELTTDVLANVVDTLALVRLGGALAADLRGNLADLLLVDALNVDVRVIGHLEGDAFGSCIATDATQKR